VYLQCYDEYIKTAKLWSKQDTLDEIKWCMVLNKKIGQKQYIFMNKRQRTSGGDVGW
jgi:hypothetical protein